MPGSELLSKAFMSFAMAVACMAILLWWWERKPMKFSVDETPTGKVFSFSIGVYSGKIRLVRSADYQAPAFIRRFDGWEIRFPLCYSDEQMDFFVLTHNPDFSKNRSHSKDLDIYREVIIRQNSALACVGGAVFRRRERVAQPT